MFDKIKKIFSKNKDLVEFDIDFNKFKDNKDIVCYDELYKALEIMKTVDKIRSENNLGKYHYKNIRTNKKTCEKIEELLKYNLLNTKNKFKKRYKEKYLLSMFSMDCLMWSPFIQDDIKDDKIVIILPENKDFTEVEKGM